MYKTFFPSSTILLTFIGQALAAVAMICGLFGAPVMAQNRASILLEATYWQDTSGKATLEDAKLQNFKHYQGNFSGGYTDAVHWFRLKLAPSVGPISLRLAPTWLDEITLFDPVTTDLIHRAGDRHPKGTNVEHHLGYVFTLPAHPVQRDVWLQLRSTSAHLLTIQALPADQLSAANTSAIVWTTFYASFLLLMLLALLSMWWVQREAVLSAYLVRHINYILYGVTYLGLSDLLLFDSLPPGLLDKGFSWLVVLTLPLGLWFDITLLKTYKPHPVLLKTVQLLAWSSLGLVGLLVAGYERLALQTTVIGLALAVPLVFAIAWTVKPEASVERLMSKSVLRGYYILVLSSLLIGLSGLLGWSPLEGLTPYLLTLHGLVSGLVMTVILFMRGQRQYQLTHLMRGQLKEAQQETILEQRRRAEQSQFLHMLMHELKNPLSVVSLALGTRGNREENLQHASRAVLDMKAIIDRCIEADQQGQPQLQRRQNTVDVSSLCLNLAQKIPQLAPRFYLQSPESPLPLQTDQQLLQIVIANLLDNASRYSDPVTAINLALELTERENITGLALSISNTPGIAGWPEDEQLFTKYYRSNGAKKESGSGLGLFLSRQLAQTLGGSIDYVPSLQHVKFILWIPLSPH